MISDPTRSYHPSFQRVLSRRELIRVAGLTVAGTAILFDNISSSSVTANAATLANVVLPPDIGQSGLKVYIDQTGHTLRGSMLDYWRSNGAASLFGNPISEPFAASNGLYSQAFENVIMQYRDEYLFTHDPVMRLFPIGRFALEESLQSEPGVWMEGDPDVSPLRFAAQRRTETDPDVVSTLSDGGVYVEDTGHSISGDILTWYRINEGAFYFGSPLTEPYRFSGRTLQYFEGGLVAAAADRVSLIPLGRKLAEQLGVDTTPVDRDNAPLFDEVMFWTVDNPNPLGDPRSPGRKWMQISISEQTLYVYQGSTLISRSLVSTGLEPNQTQRGNFHVRLRFPEQDMAGFTDQTGEVLGFGDAPPGTTPYEVSNVPHVLYFSMAAEAVHGAYWHNNFGRKMSHGCVNLPLVMAEWLYGWAPLGTEVWIHD